MRMFYVRIVSTESDNYWWYAAVAPTAQYARKEALKEFKGDENVEGEVYADSEALKAYGGAVPVAEADNMNVLTAWQFDSNAIETTSPSLSEGMN